jgi:hypothetical protein
MCWRAILSTMLDADGAASAIAAVATSALSATPLLRKA